MSKSIIIAERDNIAAVIEDNKVAEFYIHRGDVLLGDVYLASVQNVLPSIDAAFVNVGSDKMGFLHASDVSGKGALKDKLKPNQKVMVQVVKEPTGHKGPRVTTALSMPGRFLVLMPDEKGINISRKIASAKERARLKSIVSLLKPAGVGVIIRTEAEGQSESEIQEDLEFLLEKWNNIVTAVDTVEAPNLISRDQDLLYRVIREACSDEINEIVLDTPFALHRTNQLLQSWNMGKNIKVSVHKGTDALLVAKGIDKEIRTALNTKVNLPSGGYLFIQQTEALTVVDVNSGKFTSSATQNETIRKTNLESVHEIARQLRLRNIGGMIIIDFIDMDNRVDKMCILEALEIALEPDKSKPQVGQLSDLGLVELTRHRQGQSLAEIFTKKCPACNGSGSIIEDLNFLASPQEGELKAKATKYKLPQLPKTQKHHGRPQKHQQGRRIETSPSVAASSIKPIENKDENFELSFDKIKEFLESKGHAPTISNIVKFTGISPEVVNKRFSKEFNKDVFTKVQEAQPVEEKKEYSKDVKSQKAEEKVPVKRPIRGGRPKKAVESKPVEKVQVTEQPIKTEDIMPSPDVAEAPKKPRRARAASSTTVKKTTRTRRTTIKTKDDEEK